MSTLRQDLLITLGGIKLATIAIVVLQDITLVFTGWLDLRAAARSSWRHAPVVGLLLLSGPRGGSDPSSCRFWLLRS
jgi:hypothetical protein